MSPSLEGRVSRSGSYEGERRTNVKQWGAFLGRGEEKKCPFKMKGCEKRGGQFFP